jgi:predicted DsbA family dithiol-disulfide isomerase
MAAVFTNGEVISDRDTLLGGAAEVGLDPGEATRALEKGAHATDVREDEREAARLGITSVPFFVFDRRYGMAGAHPPEVLLERLESARSDGRAGARAPSAGRR